MFCQCIFSVQAEELSANDRTLLIDDYYSFVAPSKIGVGDKDIFVFDSGRLVVFGEDKTESFDVELSYCYTMCVAGDEVYLLVGDTAKPSSSACVKVFSHASGVRAFKVSESNISDIAVLGGDLLVLYQSSLTMVDEEDQTVSIIIPCISYYSRENVTKVKKVRLTSDSEWARYIVTDGDDLYLRTYMNNIILKKESSSVVAENPINLSAVSKNFVVENGVFYYFTNGGIFVGNDTRSLVEKGEVDRTISSVTDLAVRGNYLYVLDGDALAIKIFQAETGDFNRFIGSFGKDLGRLTSPTALSVKDGKIAVVDSLNRASVFQNGRVSALNGRVIKSPTEIEVAENAVYLTDDGVLCEYDLSGIFVRDYSLDEPIRYVAAGVNGSVYVATRTFVYVKTADSTEFVKLFEADGLIDRLHIGIGGKVVYVLTENTVHAYTSGGDALTGYLSPMYFVVDFTVDYKGNIYLLTGSRSIIRYARTVNGYNDPTTIYLSSDFKSYTDITLDKNGTLYILADHNVISYKKDSMSGVVIGSDIAVPEEVPVEDPLFVCVVVAPSTIAYVTPDNFEDVSYVAKGTQLMCYARIAYAGNEYLIAETEKGKVYIPYEDVTIYRAGEAPFTHARCLHTKVGVNIYRYPSKIDLEKKAQPLFSALTKTDIFEVLSVVAVDSSDVDAWGFLRVRYSDQIGYVLMSDVVSVDDDPVPIERYKMKIKSEKLGKMVVLYEDASVESEEVVRLADGTEIDALEPLDQEKEFIQVLYNGKVCYVQSQYLGEGGLTAGQTLAIVLSVVTVTASIIMFLIFRAGKRRKIVYRE